MDFYYHACSEFIEPILFRYSSILRVFQLSNSKKNIDILNGELFEVKKKQSKKEYHFFINKMPISCNTIHHFVEA